MADENTANNDSNETGSAKTDSQTPPVENKEQETKSESTGFDPSTLTDEDFNKIFNDDRLFKHSRFKVLNERAKEAEKLKAEAEKAEKKQLEEQNKFKELYEKSEAEKADLQNRVKEVAIRSAIQAQASELGVVDLEAAYLLSDKTSITVNEDGTVDGAKEVIEALISAKPYLAKSNANSEIGSGSNPNPSQTESGTKKYKLSQLQDHKFYNEHKDDIAEAMAKGLIEDDINT